MIGLTVAQAFTPPAWAEQQRLVRDLEVDLVDALDVSSDYPHSEHVQSWRPQVTPVDLGEVPENLRGNYNELDDRLGDTVFSFIDPIPCTDYKPKSIADILLPTPSATSTIGYTRTEGPRPLRHV